MNQKHQYLQAGKHLWCTIWITLLIASCHSAVEDKGEEPVTPVTPVTATTVQRGTVSDSLVLNATAAYLQNYYVKSTVNGFVHSVSTRPGDFINDGRVLFTIETKESTVIGKTISELDSSFKFSGSVNIRAMGHGYVTQLNHQPGDYVQDGEQLAVISDRSSFVFLLNMPYEWRATVLQSKTVLLVLPDGARLTGTISTVFPTVDSLTQTQTVVIRANTSNAIPQNLIARAYILKNLKEQAQTLPRSAILADETQTSFWVMKMIDSNTAVRVPVKKGLEFRDRIEIADPVFAPSDRILTSGNYGLPDTAKVVIEKQ
jgi:multidrug efflux pump subunit AcrA (membrane-fusion protein)